MDPELALATGIIVAMVVTLRTSRARVAMLNPFFKYMKYLFNDNCLPALLGKLSQPDKTFGGNALSSKI